MAHDILSPSSFATWGNCPGSPCFYQDIPEEASEFAAEGTAAHALAYEAGMKATGRTPDPMTEQEAAYVAKYKDDAMMEAAAGWASLCKGFAKDATHLGFEDSVPLDPVTGRKDATGTVDFWARLNSGLLVVADLKYGMGVCVSPERNGQLSIYATALIMRLKSQGIRCNGVKLVIYQPRMSATPRDWLPEPMEFQEFATDIVSRAKRCIQIMDEAEMGLIDPEKELIPGEAQCRFCRAKATCPALAKQVTETVKADFEVLPAEAAAASAPSTEQEAPAAPTVPQDIDRLAKVLPWLETIETWCDACRAAAKARLERGEAIPGFKLVAGRKGPRKWSDDAETVLNGMRINKAVLYEEKLISPTKAEKAAKAGDIGPRQWAKIKELIVQSDGKPAIAPESDPRPAICVSIADDFDAIPETESVEKALPAPEQPPVAASTQENKSEEDDFDFI